MISTIQSITVAAGATVTIALETPANTNYDWYCFNVNPATANILVKSKTGGGGVTLQNTAGASDTHNYIIHWIGLHK